MLAYGSRFLFDPDTAGRTLEWRVRLDGSSARRGSSGLQHSVLVAQEYSYAAQADGVWDLERCESEAWTDDC